MCPKIVKVLIELVLLLFEGKKVVIKYNVNVNRLKRNGII